ncbi:MAG TPA: phenylglyoxylate dehydrogenase [Thermodesulfobacteriota bacterium]|nr:phenylglyoxylate dehydrogenase [Thermodesulfobacteriota bacterium]
MPKKIVMDGNEAAAWGALLAKVDVAAVYPITPQSGVAETVASFIADGELKADLMDVEGEHTVLSVLQGAAFAGARTFTASCGQGLAFMFEPYFRSPNFRLPIVMCIVCRDGITPQCVWGGHQDAMTVKEAGWIHMHCENNQEITDTVVMSYKIAEHHDVMLPVSVCYDGNFLSFAAEPVEIVDQKVVDKFLGKKNINWHVALDPERPMGVDPLTGLTPLGGKLFARYRQGHCKGMQNALRVITDVHAEWKKATGHDFAPLIEEYRMNKAEYAIMTIGSMTGAGKDAVDVARDKGKKVGLIKIKTFRPFPVKALARSMSKVKAISVVDRSVNYGWNCGPLCQEVWATVPFMDKKIPVISHIGGLAGTDLTIEHMTEAIENAAKAAKGKVPKETIWLT